MARIRRVLVHDDVVLRRGELGRPTRGICRRSSGGSWRPWTASGRLGELYKKVRGSYFRFLEAAFRLCIGRVLDIAEVRESAEPRHARDERLRPAAGAGDRGAGAGGAPPHGGAARPAGALLSRSGWRSRRRGADADAGQGPRLLRPLRRPDLALGTPSPAIPASAGREMDLLLLQLEKGRLALLPAPSSAWRRRPRSEASRPSSAGGAGCSGQALGLISDSI